MRSKQLAGRDYPDDRFAAISDLVEVLNKPNPPQDKIKNLMTSAGIAYTADSLEQIRRVLNEMEKLSSKVGLHYDINP